MGAKLLLILIAFAAPLFAQVRESDGFVRVNSREEVERTPRCELMVRARTLPEADLSALTRFEDIAYLDLRCNQALTDRSLNALRALPAGVRFDFRGCRGLSTSALVAFAGWSGNKPERMVHWLPAELADGHVSAVDMGRVTIDLGMAAGVHVGQRFELYDSECALGGKFQGVIEVAAVDKESSTANLLYAADGAAPAAGSVIVNRLWRDGRYLNFWLAGSLDTVNEFLGASEILGAMNKLGAERQSYDASVTTSTELVIAGSRLFDDQAYRLARNDSLVAFVFEKGLRLYVDANPRIHRFDTDGVAHVTDSEALKRCEPGITALCLDLLDAKGAEILAGWKLSSLDVRDMQGVTATALHAMLVGRSWFSLCLRGGLSGADSVDPFNGMGEAFGRATLRLEGIKGPDGRISAPPVTKGLREALYLTTEGDRAALAVLSFRGNPNLNSQTVAFLPSWLDAETLDVSQCPNLDDATVRALFLFSDKQPEDYRDREDRHYGTVNLSGNPQLSDSAFDGLVPGEDPDESAPRFKSIDLRGCPKLTNSTPPRLAAARCERLLVSSTSKVTSEAMKEVRSTFALGFDDDWDKVRPARPVVDDGAAAQPDVWVVRNDANVDNIPQNPRRVRCEDADNVMLACLKRLERIEDLDLRNCAQVTELPGIARHYQLRRLDLRGCVGLHGSAYTPLERILKAFEDAPVVDLSLDGGHFFDTTRTDDVLKQADELVSLFRQVRKLELERDSKADDERQAIEEKIVPLRYKRDDLQMITMAGFESSMAVWSQIQPLLVESIDAMENAALYWLANPDDDAAEQRFSSAVEFAMVIEPVLTQLNENSFAIDGCQGPKLKKAALDAAMKARRVDVEAKLKDTPEPSQALLRQVAILDRIDERLRFSIIAGDANREAVAAKIGLFASSMRIDAMKDWRGFHLAYVAAVLTFPLELDLSDNAHLSDADVETLLRVRRLRFVNLKGCKGISDAAVKKLQDLRPAAKIER